jgi:hypothetical protein
MDARQPRRIDWASAQMRDGTLRVELTGHGSKAWRARFENVLAVLDTPHSSWGEARLTKKGIRVDGLQPGTESELRHFLESAVLQANADTQTEPPELGAETEDGKGEPDVDEQMAATFRSFTRDREE